MKRLESQHAIETTYRKYNFRSRLEAKWAVFFDLCKWKWAYEPIDLPGWIPDFAIGERPTLVEIKPFFNKSEWLEAIDKIIQSKYRKDVVLLGADPVMLAGEEWFDGPQFCWLVEFEKGQDGLIHLVSDLHFGFTEGNNRLGLCPMFGGWSNVLWKAPEGISHPNKWSRVRLSQNDADQCFRDKWADACNVSRWIPSSPTPPEKRRAVGQ